MLVEPDQRVVVTAPPASGPITPASAKAVGNDLARQARALLAAGYEGLIVTGGETVRAVVAGLDEPAVQVLDEPAPGIVRGRLSGGAMLVTKAGGFGDADTLIGLYEHLTEGGPA
jgi:D-threonate/D-erythronate kinase